MRVGIIERVLLAIPRGGILWALESAPATRQRPGAWQQECGPDAGRAYRAEHEGHALMPPSGRDIQMGEQFGWLTVVAKPGHKRIYRCLCDPALGGCGTQRTVQASHLLAGTTRSCGCFRRSQLPALNTTHGLSSHPEFTVWIGIIDRCTKPHKKQWRRYGGRGITVCDRWQGPDGFPHFLADMGERPTPNYELHRKDNDGPYSPENCAWISPEEHKGIHALARRTIYADRDDLRHALREIADSADVPSADLAAIAQNALDRTR